jgi:hypothetical protein
MAHLEFESATQANIEMMAVSGTQPYHSEYLLMIW